MPPEFREGLILEFDAPLTLVRHNLVVLMLTQVRNRETKCASLTSIDHYYTLWLSETALSTQPQSLITPEPQVEDLSRGSLLHVSHGRLHA